MAERLRSRDGQFETENYVSDIDVPAKQGRSGGDPSRRVGTRGELRHTAQGINSVTGIRVADGRATGKDLRDA